MTEDMPDYSYKFTFNGGVGISDMRSREVILNAGDKRVGNCECDLCGLVQGCRQAQ